MKIIYLTLAFSIGFIASQQLYTKLYDPDKLLAAANVTAANSYLTGCLEASMEPNGFIFTYKKNYCKYKAKELFDKLEALRRDPGRRVTLPQ